jgi:hypothetical protein
MTVSVRQHVANRAKRHLPLATRQAHHSRFRRLRAERPIRPRLRRVADAMALRATLDSDLARQDLGTYQEDGREPVLLSMARSSLEGIPFRCSRGRRAAYQRTLNHAPGISRYRSMPTPRPIGHRRLYLPRPRPDPTTRTNPTPEKRSAASRRPGVADRFWEPDGNGEARGSAPRRGQSRPAWACRSASGGRTGELVARDQTTPAWPTGLERNFSSRCPRYRQAGGTGTIWACAPRPSAHSAPT